MPEDSNAFLYIVGAVAVYLCSRALRVLGIALAEHFLELACEIVIFSLNICESVDSGDDLSSVLAESVEDYSQRLLTDLVSLGCDSDSSLSSCE